jgi:methyltransferase, FkbM family
VAELVQRTVRKGTAVFDVEVSEENGFWDFFESPKWEPCTVAIFESRLGPGTRYLDLGGYIGPTVLYAAALGCEVVALEPDPEVFAELQRNVTLNPALAARIELSAAALALQDGQAELRLGQKSQASLLGEGATVTVATISPETLAERIGDVDFVKIDVEGAEYLFMPRLVKALHGRPAIYLSTHPGMLVDRGSAISLLRSAPRAFLSTAGCWRHSAPTGPTGSTTTTAATATSAEGTCCDSRFPSRAAPRSSSTTACSSTDRGRRQPPGVRVPAPDRQPPRVAAAHRGLARAPAVRRVRAGDRG